jgi:predicted CoA-binding protein
VIIKRHDDDMNGRAEVLRQAHRIVLYDWPDPDVPDALALAGFDVMIHGGPSPDDVSRREVIDRKVVSRKIGMPPESADLVYVFRPLAELPRILEEMKRIGASVIWRQSGLNEAGQRDPRGCAPSPDSAQWRQQVEDAGLRYVEDAYIADTARQIAASR